MFSPVEERYHHDTTFHQIVDQLRVLLSAYHVTPSELREAAILAATMHEAQNIRPMFITKFDNFGTGYWERKPMLEFMPIGAQTGRISSVKPNVTEQEKKFGDLPLLPKIDRRTIRGDRRNPDTLYFSESYHGPYRRNQPQYPDTQRKPRTGDRRLAKPITQHVFSRVHSAGDRSCILCDLSYEYCNNFRVIACTGKPNKDVFRCICSSTGVNPPNRQKHTATCNDYNYSFYHKNL